MTLKDKFLVLQRAHIDSEFADPNTAQREAVRHINSPEIEEYDEEYRGFLFCASERRQNEPIKIVLSILCLLIMLGFCFASGVCIHQNNMLAAQINALPFTFISTEGPPKSPVAPEAVFAQTIRLDVPNTTVPNEIAEQIKAQEQKAAVSRTRTVEYRIDTKAASHSLIAGQLGKSFGTLYCNTWNMQVDLAYSNAQAVLDAENTACVLTPAIKNLPGIGEPAGAAVVLDYNFQAFSALAMAKNGDRLYAETEYGEFIYEVAKTQLGMLSQDGQSIVLDDNQNLMELCTNGSFTGIVLCTGYPFDMDIDTGYRFVVFARLVDGTTMTA